MLDEQMLRKLAFVKYVYGLAVDQSREPDPQRAAALLTFHNAVEFWLRLASEKLGAPLDRNFMMHWSLFASLTPPIDLTQKGPMSLLNDARANLKHHLALPSTLNLESYRATATDFFDENTPRVFGIPFDSVSLVEMVQCERARTLLREAQATLVNDQRKEALEKTALAFTALLDDYEDSVQDGFDSPFRFDPQGPRIMSSPRFRDYSLREFGSSVYQMFDGVGRSLSRLSQALRILALGIDYRRYVRFQRLTPRVEPGLRGPVTVSRHLGEAPSGAECNGCIDFVVDCAIHLQQLDVDMSQSDGIRTNRTSLDPPPSSPPVSRTTDRGATK
jgi:hypothetical protein